MPPQKRLWSRYRSPLILLAVVLPIYLGTASWPALLDDVDASHAIAAREMLQSGDWTVLHINGIRYLEKPPLHYWLVAASYALVGESAFATRLPLALATVGLVLVVYAFGRRFFGERAGFYAGLVMGTSIGTFIFTRFMIPEAIYALEFTAAFYLFLRAWTGTLAPRAGYLGCAALIGLATLTRAAIGPVFPPAILALFVLSTGGLRRGPDGRARWRQLPLVSGALVVLAIAAPWHLLAGLRTPHFFWFYFVNEQILRALGRRYPVDYAAVPLGLWWTAHLAWFFPWSVFLRYAAAEFPPRRLWRAGLDPAGQARALLFIWAGFVFLFFSLESGSRMEYYSFGAWPAVALLLGAGLARAEDTHDRWLQRFHLALAAIGLLAAAVLGGLLWASRGVPAAPDISSFLRLHRTAFYRVSMATLFDLTPQAFAALRLPAAIAAASLAAGLGAGWWLRRRGLRQGAALAVAVTMALFFYAANLAFRAFGPRMSSETLAEAILAHLHPDDRIVIYGKFDGASGVGFYTKRRIWVYNGRSNNGLEFGSYYPDAPRIFLNDDEFSKLWSGPSTVFLVVPPDEHRAALSCLPPQATYVLAESGGKVVYVNRPLVTGQATRIGQGRGGP